VDIGCAQIDRIDQDFLQKFDHRGVVNLGSYRLGCRGGIVFEEVDVEIVADQIAQTLLGVLTELLQQLQQCIVLHDDWFDNQAGLEFDLVECLRIGGVGDCNRNLVAALGQYDDALPQHQLGVDDFFRQRRDIERRQIERRITVGFGTEQGEFAFFDMAALE